MVIVFDLDDTLYMERDFQFSGYRAVGDWLLKHCNVTSFFYVASTLFERGVRKNVFDLALERMGIDSDPKVIQKLVHIFRDHSPSITLCADAEFILPVLRRKGIQLGVITDGYLSVQRKKVRALSLEDKVDVVVYTDEYGRDKWKPHPYSYEKIMMKFQCRGENCVYIGDNPSKDFITPKRLGWKTVRVKRQYAEHGSVIADPEFEADLSILNLGQLENCLLLDCDQLS